MSKILYLVFLCLLAACSSSRYAANFQNYKPQEQWSTVNGQMKPAAPIEPEHLFASTDTKPVLEREKIPALDPAVTKQIRKTYFQMSKSERKTLRVALKSALKSKAGYPPANSGRQWWQGWDMDLKMAAIFGAIGTVAMIIYVEPFFIIGAAALIIGLVFLIKWFVRQ